MQAFLSQLTVDLGQDIDTRLICTLWPPRGALPSGSDNRHPLGSFCSPSSVPANIHFVRLPLFPRPGWQWRHCFSSGKLLSIGYIIPEVMRLTFCTRRRRRRGDRGIRLLHRTLDNNQCPHWVQAHWSPLQEPQCDCRGRDQ
jgi:hypothetical protein